MRTSGQDRVHGRLRRGIVPGAVGALALTASVLAGPPTASADAPATVPLVQHDSSLADVDGVASNDVWAVGFHADGGFRNAIPLTLHFDGTRWSTVPSPRIEAVLTGVAAISANDVWAVGQRYLNNATGFFALHWDGRVWTQVDVPTSGQQYDTLLDVSGFGPSHVVAHGQSSSGEGPITYSTFRWDGSSWHLATGAFRRTTAEDGSRADGWAVGETGRGASLARHWGGSGWTRTATVDRQPPNTLLAVSGQGSNVWAAGRVDQSGPAYAEHWDGTSWALADNGIPSGFVSSLSTAPDGDTWLTLDDLGAQHLSHWDGSAWQPVTNPAAGHPDGQLGGVKTFSADDAWAVGSWLLCDGQMYCYDQRILVRWNGSQWTDYHR